MNEHSADEAYIDSELETRLSPAPTVSEGTSGSVTITSATKSWSIKVTDVKPTRRRMDAIVRVRSATHQRTSGAFHTDFRSLNSRSTATRHLGKVMPGIVWQDAFNRVAQILDDRISRAGKPIHISYSPHLPVAIPLLKPLLYENEQTTFFGLGGSAKTTLAAAVAVSLVTGECIILGFSVERPIRVAVWDFENPTEDAWQVLISKILRGANLQERNASFMWFKGRSVLPEIAEDVREIALSNDIKVPIIDSLSWAAGGKLEDQETVGSYDRAMRVIGLSALHIAHDTKSADSGMPFGSAFWHHWSRATWQFRLTGEVGREVVDVGLFNKKVNNRGAHPPLGLRITHFSDRISFERIDVRDVPGLDASVPVKSRIERLLGDGVSRTASAIAVDLQI